jgi:uncharacterized protein YjdB
MKARLFALGLTLSLLFSLFGLVHPTASYAAPTAAYSANVLDYGIYWFGLGNVAQKAEPGVANPYFNPGKPTVIYIHGWQNGSSQRGSRETFNYKQNDATYGVDVNMADAWINAGWNIGIFYWNQFADEGEVKDAEAKIWSAAGPQGMRWRKADGSYSTVGAPGTSAADLFVAAYRSAMSGYTGSNVRLGGHSLGSQMVINGGKQISDLVDAGALPANLRPKRIALLDPFWSKDAKSYLGNKWTGEVSRDYVTALKTKGVVFEQYKSSGITDVGVGDANAAMERLTAFSSTAPWYVPSWDLGGKHIAAYNEYFYSFASAPPIECTISWGVRTKTGYVAASAATSDARIAEMMRADRYWVQVEGRYTQNPNDDWYERKSR